MKVICIDASKGKIDGNVPQFKEGEIVTVEQSKYYPDAYHVLEYPSNERGSYVSWLKHRFVPISSIDETELIKERELLTINN